MYKITIPTGESFITEKPNFIQVHSSNCFLLTEQNKADGIVYCGTPYLFVEGTKCCEVDGGDSICAVESLLSNHNLSSAALELRQAVQYFIRSLTDETEILEVASVFPKYQVGKIYKTKDVFTYGENSVGDPQLYQVLQDHTSTEEWTPDTSTSLYKAIGVTKDGYPEWVQPLGASDAYSINDIVSYKGTLYKSLIDGNVWSPDDYPAGWVEYTEQETPDVPDSEELPNVPNVPESGVTEPKPEPEPDTEPELDVPEENYAEWVQPSGADDAYNTGDIVIYNSVLYESTIDGNVWSPESYPNGWKEYSK